MSITLYVSFFLFLSVSVLIVPAISVPFSCNASRTGTFIIASQRSHAFRTTDASAVPFLLLLFLVFAFVICEAFFVFAKQCKTNSED